MIELTRFAKKSGPLTKRIFLDPAGKIISDGSACLMSRGYARRVRLNDLHGFAALVSSLEPHEAIALGSLRQDLPDQTEIVTQDKLREMNGAAASHLIARTAEHIAYRLGSDALALIDIDTKGMPDEVKARVREAGGFSGALVSLLPELATCGRVVRRSTSTGLSRADTGENLPGSNGLHVFLHVRDGADVERFLRTLHERCWLAGFGWHMVGAGGQLLERSLVDRMVYAAERLVFEGAPVLESPLVQDASSRRPQVHEGPPLDTVHACPPLRIVETSRLKQIKAASSHSLAPERAKERERFVAGHAARLAERTGVAQDEARRTIERQCEGILLPDVELPWDDEQFAGCTVADVLADPARFAGATMADPFEGTDYGRCKAKIMRRTDGTPWVNSFAHGRTTYELRHDAKSARAAVEAASEQDAPDAFVKMALNADLDADQLEALRNRAADRAGVGKRAINTKLKAATDHQAQSRQREGRERRSAERRDPRPQVPAPLADAPWLPQVEVLNDVLGSSQSAEPPMRDLDGAITFVRSRCVESMHTLSAADSNAAGNPTTQLPSPEHLLLTRLTEIEVAELIEQHIDYQDEKGRSVHLGAPFVRHFATRHDEVLPTVTAVATLPVVLPNGQLLSGEGLNRERRIVFRVPAELQRLLPATDDCTEDAVATAMQFLTDEWLVDVATDYSGKCVIIALAATILERLILPERPFFFVTAGQRGGGKTTVLNMVSMAVLGLRASAAAWSSSEEERRKSLFAYLSEGVPFLVWDNLSRGLQIACPSIEKALTAETYSDRVLGESTTRTVPAHMVQAASGNNVGPRGDMASRSLSVRLVVDRPDPENREFRHADSVEWTFQNRGAVLAALYTVLLGNPRLGHASPGSAETRFKAWWHVVGSAIEYAARVHCERADALVLDVMKHRRPVKISFRELFLSGEADEEQTTSLATVLETLSMKWPSGFKASDVAHYAGSADEQAITFKGALEIASGKSLPVVSSVAITWRLKAIVDAPADIDGKILALRYTPDHHGGLYTIGAPRG